MKPIIDYLIQPDATDATSVVRLDTNTDDADNSGVALNFSIAPIKEISARSGGYSKTINVPATYNNQQALELMHEVQIADKSILDKKPGTILVNKVPVMTGHAQLSQVNKRNGPTQYLLNYLSDNMDWIDKLKAKKLNELTYDDIVYNSSTVFTSFVNDYADGYVFPLINYGAWTNDFPGGAGAYKSYVTVEDMYPAFFIVTMVKKMFNEIGYNVSGAFLNDPDMQKLIFPYIGKDVLSHSNAYVHNNSAVASSTVNQVVTSATNSTISFQMVYNDDSTTPNFDGSGSNYNTSLWQFDASVQGKHNVFTHFWITTNFEIPPLVSNIKVHIKVNGYNVHTEQFPLLPVSFISVSHELQLYPGDKVEIWADLYCLLPDIAFSFLKGSQFGVIKTKQIEPGDTFNLASALPDYYTQFDFVNGLVGLFNLYLQTNVVNREVIISMRDDFFEATTEAIDWSTKLDAAKGLSYTYYDGYKKTQRFKYQDDGGDAGLNAPRTSNPVAHADIDLANRFDTGMDETGTSFFAPTYMILDRRLTGDVNTAPLVPAMWSELPAGDFDYPARSYDFQPRILYYKGWVQELNYRGHYPWWYFGGATNFYLHTYYPKCFFTCPDNPDDFCLNYNDTKMPTVDLEGNDIADGLVKKYWNHNLETINNSAILEGYFNLNEYDIATLDFRKLVYLEDTQNAGYWILSEIIDWNPATQIAKCRLVQYNVYINADRKAMQTYTTEDRALSTASEKAVTNARIHIGENMILVDENYEQITDEEGNWVEKG